MVKLKPCVQSTVFTQRGRLLLIQTKDSYWLAGLSARLGPLLLFYGSLGIHNAGAGFAILYIYMIFTSYL